MTKKAYTQPSLKDLGSVSQLTKQAQNKVGTNSDAFSNTNNLVGSLVNP
jgi:hypothetical protein